MENKQINKYQFILSICLIIAAFYFHNGYFRLINEVIYSDAAIPKIFEQDKFYFMQHKLKWKRNTIYGLWMISLLLLTYHWLIPTSNKRLKIIIRLQFICCSIALFFWMIMPKGILFF